MVSDCPITAGHVIMRQMEAHAGIPNQNWKTKVLTHIIWNQHWLHNILSTWVFLKGCCIMVMIWRTLLVLTCLHPRLLLHPVPLGTTKTVTGSMLVYTLVKFYHCHKIIIVVTFYKACAWLCCRHLFWTGTADGIFTFWWSPLPTGVMTRCWYITAIIYECFI